MKDPARLNLMTPAEVRNLGWQAEARDAAGHLIGVHAPFDVDFAGDDEIVTFVREALAQGATVTIWPRTES